MTAANEHAARLREIAGEMARSAKVLSDDYLPLLRGDEQVEHTKKMIRGNQRIADDLAAAAEFLEGRKS